MGNLLMNFLKITDRVNVIMVHVHINWRPAMVQATSQDSEEPANSSILIRACVVLHAERIKENKV